MCYNEKLKKDEKCDCIEFKCTHLTTFVSAPGETLTLKTGEDATVPEVTPTGGSMVKFYFYLIIFFSYLLVYPWWWWWSGWKCDQHEDMKIYLIWKLCI